MDIVDEIRTNHEAGALRLEREYKPQLLAVAARLCPDTQEAEALVYRTMYEVVRCIETLTNPDSFFGWMCGIMSNQCRKLNRRKIDGKILYTDRPIEAEDGLTGADNVVQAVDATLLREAIEALPPKLKEAVLLRYFADMPLTQVARFLTIPVGTVNSRLHMARITLAMRLGAKLKKPAVALIAAGLLLLGATASVVFSVGGQKELVAQESSAAHGIDLKSIDMCDPVLSPSTTTEENTMKRLLKISAAVAAAAYTHVAKAAVSYSYENDNKTLVVTVDSGTSWLQDDQYQAALNNNTVTNLVKRGAGAFGVNGTARNFIGDVRIEDGQIQMRGTNPLGTKGRVYIAGAKSLVLGAGTAGAGSTVKKEIVTESKDGSGSWTGFERKIYLWAGDTVVDGKLIFGNRDNWLRAYAGAKVTFKGGVGDLDTGGYPYFQPSGGATFVFSDEPYSCKKQFNIQPQTSGYPLDAQGFAGHFVFAAAGNTMSQLGYTTDGNRMSLVEVKTTVDWAFDNELMSVAFGNDSVFDLCGTEQRVGQFNVKVTTGNPSVVTNSSATPATLHMTMMYGPNNSAANIRFGGNLSVVFEKNIWTTIIDHEMTATGDLTISGDGDGGANSAILQFTENGSWAKAKNLTVNGVGKIKIANPNALGRRANVNLASNSSLEIASGVTVQVRTLTVGGVQKPNGDYTFGSGTLRVFKPGMVVRIH